MHACRSPRLHRLLMGGALVVWLVAGVGIGLPRLVYGLTGNAPLAGVSVGLGLVPGTMFVYALASWRCRPQCRAGKGPSLVMPLAVLAWMLRES